MSAMAKNLERFVQAINSHDRENPTHTTHGLGLSGFDLDRLGIEVGEEILPGITIQQVDVPSGVFRVLCDGEHDAPGAELRAAEAIPAGAAIGVDLDTKKVTRV